MKIYNGRARAQANGKEFEREVVASCMLYEKAGLAKIEKQQEPFVIAGYNRNGTFTCRRSEKAGVDFKGVLKGGQCIVFECKHKEAKRADRNMVRDHQLNYLLEHEALGSVAFVLLSFINDNSGQRRCYAIPPKVWRDMKEIFGKVSVREEDIQQYRVPTRGRQICFLERTERA